MNDNMTTLGSRGFAVSVEDNLVKVSIGDGEVPDVIMYLTKAQVLSLTTRLIVEASNLPK